MTEICEEAIADHKVNFPTPRPFKTILKSSLKETFFPDDPFRQFNNLSPFQKSKKFVQYSIPIFQWLPSYNFRLFRYDLLAGLTVASLAIPQGISYARLANLPLTIGLYSSFVPPLIYAVLGNSKDISIGNIAAASLLLGNTISKVASATDEQSLYLHLVFTATFFAGVFQATLGLFRLGILIDFLSHSTIVGFMSGTAVIIGLQQLKGLFGLTRFTNKTDVISVMHSVFSQTHQWQWESIVCGVIFLSFLLFTRHVKNKKPRLFWVSAIGPMVTVLVGCVFAFLVHSEKHGIPTVGHLNKGLNPLSVQHLNFNSKYLPTVIKAGLITGILALAEGIAIGRSFAEKRHEKIDGNKEMIAFGMANIAGSFTSCFLTTGPFSKSAVNHNSGSKTPMSNVVMAICIMLTLLFLAPLFSYTPLVVLSAIIMSAMLGLIDYHEACRLFKVDKFDFCIAMAGFLGVVFIDMDIGLMLSVGLSIVRALLYVARPEICSLGVVPNTNIYSDVKQYPYATRVPRVLILQLGSPLYFANSSYVRERISRFVEDEGAKDGPDDVEHVILDMGAVSSIDMTGIEMLTEVEKNLQRRGMKVSIVNPRLEVMEKLLLSDFIKNVGKDSIFLLIDDAIEACRFNMIERKTQNGVGIDHV